MPKLYVQIDSECIHDYHDGEQYGDWHTINSYRGCTVSASGEGRIGYRTNGFEVDFEYKIGQVVFPVIVGYGAGDSFGRSEGNSVCVAVVDSPEVANRIKDAIVKDESTYGANTLEVEGYKIYTYDWKGYFESFEWCRVETELVRA